MALRRARFFTVRLNHCPWRISGVGVIEHRFFGGGVVLPFIERGHINRRELPLFERVIFSLRETLTLHITTDLEPKLDEDDTAAHQIALEFRALTHEFSVFLIAAKPHNPFNTRAVVP